MLWRNWWELVRQLRGACTRSRTFLWMVVCLMGMTVRTDLMGVSSIVRALGLVPSCYGRILDFFHSPALRCPHAALARPGLQTTRRGAPGPAAQYSSERVSGLPQVRQKDTGCQEDSINSPKPTPTAIHFRPLPPSSRRAHAGRPRRLRSPADLSHPRRYRILQPRKAEAPGQNDTSGRFAGHGRGVHLCHRRILRIRHNCSRSAWAWKPPGHEG